MARFISDQNKVVMLHESGTYASTSGNGIWLGQVTENSVTDNEGLIETRYLGTANRSIDKFEQGPIDIEGTLTYNPIDMRLVFFGIGSVYDESGATSTHTATEINTDLWQNPFISGTGNFTSPMSFTLEDSKQSPGTGKNFVRSLIGCVPNTITLSASQGEKVGVELGYMAQSNNVGSGATTSVEEVSGTRPYLWSDCTLEVSKAGNVSGLNTVKEFSLEINQNREGPHYINGSRVIATPVNGNRDYTLSLTTDFDGEDSDMLYNEFYKGGSKFNVKIDMNHDTTAGSQHAEFHLSGCYITSFEVPSTNEGTTETTIEIRPGSLFAQSWDSSKNLPYGIYNPW